MCDAWVMRTRSSRGTGLVVGLVAIAASFVLSGVAAAKPSPSLKIVPSSALVGQPVAVRGHGFRPRMDGAVLLGARRVARFRASVSGTFVVRFRVPSDDGGRLRVVAEQTRDRHGLVRLLSHAGVGFQVLGVSGDGD